MASELAVDRDIAIKKFIDLCTQINSSTCSMKRNISESTAIKFLHARKFDVPRAVSLYEQHEQIRIRECLYNINPDMEPLQSELSTGKFTILSARDSSGAAIALFTANKHIPLSVTHTTTLQGIVYQLDCALQDTDTQKAGLIFIYDMSGSKYSNFDYDLSQKILTLLKGGYPARLKKVLIVTAPLWFKAPFKILRLFVREKLRERVFTVSVPTLSLHVPRQALPKHLGGILEINHSLWLQHCRKSMTNREDELLANIGPTKVVEAIDNCFDCKCRQLQAQNNHLSSTDVQPIDEDLIVDLSSSPATTTTTTSPAKKLAAIGSVVGSLQLSNSHCDCLNARLNGDSSVNGSTNSLINNSAVIAELDLSTTPANTIASCPNISHNQLPPAAEELKENHSLTNGLHSHSIGNGSILTPLIINNTSSKSTAAITATAAAAVAAATTEAVLAEKILNGVLDPATISALEATTGLATVTPSDIQLSTTNNIISSTAGTTTATGLGEFWSENPPSSASSGFSDDDSLAGQEGDPKNIEQVVQMAKTLGRKGLMREYSEIRNREPEGTFVQARLRCNSNKNRYTDVLCYDHSRVVLSNDVDEECADYINANFVDGYKQKNAYISTQGPLPKTSHDFWRMVWEQHCLVIVMTTRVMERGRVKCGQYWEPTLHGSLQFGNFNVKTLSIENNEDYTITSLELKNTKTDEKRLVSHWQFTSWPDYGVPSTAMAMINFLHKVREKQAAMVKSVNWKGHPRGPPIIVHCSAGIGRTGTFITLDICISRLEDVGTVDIRGTVEKIRAQRAYSIQMPDQYVFCHLALIEYAFSRGMLKSVDLKGFDDSDNESPSQHLI